MNQPVNLNKARKARAKSDAKAQANENAVRFGRTKAERERDAADPVRLKHHLDQHMRDRDR